MDISHTCCFMGPQLKNLRIGPNENSPYCRRLKEALLREIIYLIEGHGVFGFLSDLSPGIEQWGAEALLSLRPYYPKLELHAVLSDHASFSSWPAVYQAKYCEILRRCTSSVTIPETEQLFPSVGKRTMFKHSRFVLAVWDGSAGETADLVSYAQDSGCRVLQLHPRDEGTAIFLPGGDDNGR